MATSLSLSCSKTLAGAVVNGTLAPAIGGASVSIVYTSPTGSTMTHSAATDAGGHYSDSFTAAIKGTWHVQAHWAGDGDHLPSDSGVCTLTVGAG